MKRMFALLLILLAVVAQSAEDVDLQIVHRIKTEAFQNGKVMDHIYYLTDVNGPRLSGSPGYKTAADWTVRQLKEWGIGNARLESWGKFGRSWSLKKFDAHVVEPFYAPVNGFPHAWSRSTQGRIKAELIYAPVFSAWEDDMKYDPAKVRERVKQYAEQYRGKLRGKIVLTDPRREHDQPQASPSERLDEEALESYTESPDPFRFESIQWPITRLPADPKERDRFLESLPLEIDADLWEQQQKALNTLIEFLNEEGALGTFTSSRRGIGGSFYAVEAGSHHAGNPVPAASIALQREQYGRLIRLLQKNVRVMVEMEMEADFPEQEMDGLNVIAEIPGGKKRMSL